MRLSDSLDMYDKFVYPEGMEPSDLTSNSQSPIGTLELTPAFVHRMYAEESLTLARAKADPTALCRIYYKVPAGAEPVIHSGDQVMLNFYPGMDGEDSRGHLVGTHRMLVAEVPATDLSHARQTGEHPSHAYDYSGPAVAAVDWDESVTFGEEYTGQTISRGDWAQIPPVDPAGEPYWFLVAEVSETHVDEVAPWGGYPRRELGTLTRIARGDAHIAAMREDRLAEIEAEWLFNGRDLS